MEITMTTIQKYIVKKNRQTCDELMGRLIREKRSQPQPASKPVSKELEAFLVKLRIEQKKH